MAEKKCKWYFPEQQGGQEIGPNNAVMIHFNNEAATSLVRESIQNSLDAVFDKTKPVRVCYSFELLNDETFESLLDLKSHIQGCLDYYSTNKNATDKYSPMINLFENSEILDGNLGYIRVSDYNTRGMNYNPNQTDSPFYAFVRSVGVSAKQQDNAGGSFGFGKAAYFNLSPINSIIVSTCTDKNQYYFEGISSLCTHMYDGVKKMSVGYYDNCNGNAPISNLDEIPDAFKRSEPGTDINILGVECADWEDERNIVSIIKAVLKNFWFAIYNKKLEVMIKYSNKEKLINRESLLENMDEYFPAEYEDINKGSNSSKTPRPYFDAVYNKNKVYTDHIPLIGDVSFYINKQKGGRDRIIYMRSLQMLVYDSPNRTNYGFYGMFYCGNPEGNELLRHLENPQHNEWKAHNWKSGNYTNPMGTNAIKEISKFIEFCVADAFATREDRAINIKGLGEFLYIPTEYSEDDDMDSESLVGEVTGKIKDEGFSYTTELDGESENPVIIRSRNKPSSGKVLVHHKTKAKNSNEGTLSSGHGKKHHITDNIGIPLPGDNSTLNKEDSKGKLGIYSRAIEIDYRSFSQVENGEMYHYIILHPDKKINNLRLSFQSVGESGDENLEVLESSEGDVNGAIISNLHINTLSYRIRVRFTDNLKHSLILVAEEVYER